jgi:hypothetical protein
VRTGWPRAGATQQQPHPDGDGQRRRDDDDGPDHDESTAAVSMTSANARAFTPSIPARQAGGHSGPTGLVMPASSPTHTASPRLSRSTPRLCAHAEGRTLGSCIGVRCDPFTYYGRPVGVRRRWRSTRCDLTYSGSGAGPNDAATSTSWDPQPSNSARQQPPSSRNMSCVRPAAAISAASYRRPNPGS